MDINDFQGLMKNLFIKRDSERGTMETFSWFVEEVGELAHELRQFNHDESRDRKKLEGEFADVLAWLCSLANLTGVDLQRVATEKYPGKCPKCGSLPCSCKTA
ncbi:MAG: MazG nucleotide pyrophosphohydrolase domain-containing protein [Promethearchaeota archaeon]